METPCPEKISLNNIYWHWFMGWGGGGVLLLCPTCVTSSGHLVGYTDWYKMLNWHELIFGSSWARLTFLNLCQRPWRTVFWQTRQSWVDEPVLWFSIRELHTRLSVWCILSYAHAMHLSGVRSKMEGRWGGLDPEGNQSEKRRSQTQPLRNNSSHHWWL